MEKLELKHLAPYLPYKLYCFDTLTQKKRVINTGQGSSNNWVGIKTVIRYKHIYKPILRPLSDLTKEIEVNGNNFIPNIESFIYLGGRFLDITLEEDENRISKLPYDLMLKLFEWHFDVFGLIEKGLAIDINTFATEAL